MSQNQQDLANKKLTSITRQVIERYHAGWKNRDVDAIMAMFHDDIEYHDFSLNQTFYINDLPDYISSSLPSSQGEAITHIDDIRADGHTGFIQYEHIMQGASYRSSEAITVKDNKIIQINEYGVLVSNTPHNTTASNPSPDNPRLGLSAKQLANLAQDLHQYFQVSQPYLNHELNLQQVADATGYTRNQISYFLNRVLGQTFYQYVHQSRIDYLLQKIDELLSSNSSPLPPPDIHELAFSAGFNSVSVFYKHFKLITGVSPKAYLKQRSQII
jgi:AraC-like DNA-binding protein/ketosteroid isomerase-like protein